MFNNRNWKPVPRAKLGKDNVTQIHPLPISDSETNCDEDSAHDLEENAEEIDAEMESEIDEDNDLRKNANIRKIEESIDHMAVEIETLKKRSISIEKKLDAVLFFLKQSNSQPTPKRTTEVSQQIAMDTKMDEVLSLLKESNGLLALQKSTEVSANASMDKKVDAVLSLLKESNTRSAQKRKIEVPTHIAKSIRDGYLKKSKEKNLCWKSKNQAGVQLKFNSKENKPMTDCIKSFVKHIYPEEQQGVIIEGLKTNFESFKAKKRREENGKQKEHNRKMAKRSRMTRKTKNRKRVLKDTLLYSEDKKEHLQQALVLQYCSSEDTDPEDEDSFIVRPLLWRSEKYCEFIQTIDKAHTNKLTKRSKKQSNARKIGAPSTRKKPAVLKGHEWIFKTDQSHAHT